MTCEQGLLRLLWEGPEVGVLRDWLRKRVKEVAQDSIFAGHLGIKKYKDWIQTIFIKPRF